MTTNSVQASLEAVLDHLEGNTDANTVTDLRRDVATLRAFSEVLPQLMGMPATLAEILVALEGRMRIAQDLNAGGSVMRHARYVEAREARNEALVIAAQPIEHELSAQLQVDDG